MVFAPDIPFSRQESLWQTGRSDPESRGDQPRHQQNRLLFLAADYDSVSRLKDQVRRCCMEVKTADFRETRLKLDNFRLETREGAAKAQDALQDDPRKL